MIIDCHGHFTTVPAPHKKFRAAQLARLDDPRLPEPVYTDPSDDAIREAIENHQLRILRERGGDMMIFSPQASAMEHHVPDPAVARTWARVCNDLIYRVVSLFPENFAGVCQLPQTPGGSLDAAVAELRRCVDELGFVGCNLNPDPSGGWWTSPPLTDEYWFPLYEAMTELDVPGMVHVSASCNPAFHALGAHYLNADTSAFMQLLQGDLFGRFPALRLVIPHGGGAVPYHWGRYRGLAARMGRPDPSTLLGNVFFDTCVYHQPGIDLLARVVPATNILFASEMLGAVRGPDPDTGIAWDDTKTYVDALGLNKADRRKVFERNARRVYPRLGAHICGRSRSAVRARWVAMTASALFASRFWMARTNSRCSVVPRTPTWGSSSWARCREASIGPWKVCANIASAGLCVAWATRLWNSPEIDTGYSSPVCSKASARSQISSSSAMSVSSARSHTRGTIASSMTCRASVTSAGVSTDSVSRSASPSPNQALVGAVTNAPPWAPTRMTTRPLASNPRSASRTVTRLTPKRSPSSRSEGSRSPATRSPSRISRRIWSTIMLETRPAVTRLNISTGRLGATAVRVFLSGFMVIY